MANLDTTDKRRSATGVFHLFTVHHIPGSLDVQDRMNTTYIYSGISAGGAVPVTALPPRNLLLLRVGR